MIGEFGAAGWLGQPEIGKRDDANDMCLELMMAINGELLDISQDPKSVLNRLKDIRVDVRIYHNRLAVIYPIPVFKNKKYQQLYRSVVEKHVAEV